MPRKSDAKERMIASAQELFQRQGYHGTGLKQILEDSGAPRGSLYFHFPGGKEELAIAAIAAASGPLQERFQGLAEAESPAQVLSIVADTLAWELEESGFEKGCPVATVALDAARHQQVVALGLRECFQLTTNQVEPFDAVGRDRADHAMPITCDACGLIDQHLPGDRDP